MWPLVAGTLLPDLIDKPLYYAHLSTFISCTRTFGHTGLFLIGTILAAWFARSRVLAAIAVGVATHLVIDCVMDAVAGGPFRESSAIVAAVWPLLGTSFARYDTAMFDHLRRLISPAILLTEAIGLILILAMAAADRRRPAPRSASRKI